MFKYSYHNRVMDNGFKWNIIRAARRTGRTWLSLQWVLEEAAQKVLFITPNQRNVDLYVSMLQDIYPGLVRIHNKDTVNLANGTTVYFHVANEDNPTGRGRRVDKVIVDDAGYVDLSVLRLIQAYTSVGARALITASGVSNNSLFEYFEKKELQDVYYQEYSYINALADEVYNEDFINEMKATLKDLTFHNEYGPWDTIEKFNKGKNKNYKHLLKK